MHKSGSGWRRLAWGLAFGVLLGCSGGRTAALGACDGGACDGGPGAGGFPYIGPSCTAAQFPASCWQCVESSCASVESCLQTDCGAYFSCYCACAAGDGACQDACPQSTACQTCATNITRCQLASCPSQCGADAGPPQSTCATLRTCASGVPLVACSVTSNGLCQSQYYTVGSQTFDCAACGDCTAAAGAAGMACP